MRTSELRGVIRDMIVEFRTESNINTMIDEFGELSDDMDRLKNQLEGLKKRYSQIEDELRPILEELNRFNQKSIQTENSWSPSNEWDMIGRTFGTKKPLNRVWRR